LSIENANKHWLCEALFELKELQDRIMDSQTKYFGHLLLKLVGTDTIPFLFITNNGIHLKIVDTVNHFETEFFRIESIDREQCIVTVSLLRALDYEGHDTNLITEIVRLERTSTKRYFDLEYISGIQLFSHDLLIKKIILEPKW